MKVMVVCAFLETFTFLSVGKCVDSPNFSGCHDLDTYPHSRPWPSIVPAFFSSPTPCPAAEVPTALQLDLPTCNLVETTLFFLFLSVWVCFWALYSFFFFFCCIESLLLRAGFL